MIKYKKFVPITVAPMIVKTTWGETRRVLMAHNGTYYFTDCTNPMQNCYCSRRDILEWEYENNELMKKLLFIENEEQKREDAENRQRQADEIIATIKFTLWDKIKLTIFRK